LSASSRENDAYFGRTYGLYSELRYFPRRRVGGAYLLAVLGLANTRVDNDILLPEVGIVINGGTDATTGVLGGGTGFRFRTLGTEASVDFQYQWRTNATHGHHAVPLRLAFRWRAAVRVRWEAERTGGPSGVRRAESIRRADLVAYSPLSASFPSYVIIAAATSHPPPACS
jgi:hypothetical protein